MPRLAPDHRSVPDIRCADSSIAAALQLLLEAHVTARRLQRDEWDFAVELHRLRASGLTNTHLRLLICQGYLAHAEECSRADDCHRSFRGVANLRLVRRTCFVLTPAGLALATAPDARAADRGSKRARPVWDACRRELRLHDLLVKCFRQPADCQERVLAAFEEEGWPPRIDDPLPPVRGQHAKHRLHSTISNLNRGQRQALLRFSGGGDGQSVLWRPLDAMSCADQAKEMAPDADQSAHQRSQSEAGANLAEAPADAHYALDESQ